MAKSSEASPEGLVVNRKWKIGRKLGDGVCGSVHALIHQGSEDKEDLAVKVAPLPDPSTSKKSQAARKRHADILHYEGLVYQNHLVELRGTLIPELPLRPATGDIEGFRYLIMEQMAAPFDTVVSDIASGKRHFGQVASHMLHIIQQSHQRKLLVIDIKPDNFMIDTRGNIVMIDLGLVQSYGSMGGHRPNAGGASVVGTPLYASLHLFDGDTPSRRDDLEALSYLLMEVVLQIVKKEDLPWAHGESEAEIGTLKRDSMGSTAIWKDIATNGNTSVSKALKKFFEDVRKLGYSKTPDYDALNLALKDLTLMAGASKKKQPTTRRSTTTTRTQRSTRGSTAAKITRASATTTTRAARASTRNTATTSTRASATSTSSRAARAQKRASPQKPASRRAKRQEAINVDCSDESDEDDDGDDFHSVMVEQEQHLDGEDFHTCAGDGDDFHTCTGDGDQMEWENEMDSKPRTNNDSVGVTLNIIEGPHEGESLSLIRQEDETVIFGVRPGVNHGYELAGDSEVDLQHASMQLNVQGKKKLVTVLVTDLKSSSGTYVGKTLLVANRAQKVFINDIVTMGDTRIKVCPLAIPNTSVEEPSPVVQVSNLSDVEMRDMDVEDKSLVGDDAEDPLKENKTPGVHFIGDAHEFVLTAASKELVLGSDPAVANIVIPGIAAISCKLTLLVSSRQVMSVNVIASGETVNINGNSISRDGKLFMGDVLQVGDEGLSWKMSSTGGIPAKQPTLKSQEIKKPQQSSNKPAAASNKTTTRRGMVLLFTEGPYKGEKIEMHEGGMDNLVLGANPKPRSGDKFQLTKDSSITDASHVRLELNTNKKKGFFTMTVTDLRSSSGTTINSMEVGKGKKQTAFCGDVIALGGGALKLQPL